MARRRVDEAKGEAKKMGKQGEKDVLEQLVIILAQLSLANSAELREITGMLVVTYLVPIESKVATACLVAGKDYQELVTELRATKDDIKKKREAGEVMEDAEELGAPHVSIAMQGILCLIRDVEVLDDLKAEVKQWWLSRIQGKSEMEVKQEIQMWKLRKPQKGKPVKLGKGVKGEYAKVNFSFSNNHVGDMICKALEAIGGIRKTGAAPRGWLERESMKLLDRFRKGKPQ